MYHFQSSVNDWPRAVAKLPSGALVKAIDRGDILRDAKGINPNLFTMLRHHGGPQSLFDGRGFEAYKPLAREFYSTFIDGTFKAQYAQHTDFIQEWNEYLASSHSGQELQDRIDWARAAAWVWRHEYRTQADYSHIRLALVSAPVGNDIHRAFAEIALEYDCVLSYHSYDKFIGDHQRDPFSWRYHCGRWHFMEQSWGLKPDWLFGEAGPYAGVLEGWRHSSVLNGDTGAYVAAVRRWIQEIKTTPAYAEGRVKGFALFTTGGTSEWKHYETRQPEMDALADMVRNEWTPVTLPPPPPPPPEPDPRRYVKKAHVVAPGIRRRLFDAVIDEAWQNKESVFFSIDDAMQPAANDGLVTVTARTVTVWNVEQVLSRPEEEAKAALEEFASVYYPEPDTVFNYRRLGRLFVADEWAPPIGTKAERASGSIWPGGWIDATPFATRYQLGSSFYYHPGCDLNLNTPTFDMDRNKPVYAAASGKIVFAGVPSTAWQGVVVMRHTSADGKTVYTRYAHLQPDEIVVQAEDWLKVGELIGLTGRNMVGSTPGPYHLHWEVSVSSKLLKDPGYWPPPDDLETVLMHWVDPKTYLEERINR